MYFLFSVRISGKKRSADPPKPICLRQHRTILTVQTRRRKFRQMKQNFACVVGPAQRNFVKYDGVYANRSVVKAKAVNSAVLP